MPSVPQCENRATYVRYWPGSEPDHVCLTHKQDSEKVLAAMGWTARFEPLPDDVDYDCACSAGFSQEVKVR